ncbi:hypothetical protein TARUN_4743 [Trichoderma arundinaceum]|uniref:Uncharacterized protein n=1 Tax=Trichoderma arundinaceum TaxID=490622 RepID=A0A395NNF4_TRIAR|nr:hypothetical protein TARUN_4743 [Trichoderma arundinaceum]
MFVFPSTHHHRPPALTSTTTNRTKAAKPNPRPDSAGSDSPPPRNNIGPCPPPPTPTPSNCFLPMPPAIGRDTPRCSTMLHDSETRGPSVAGQMLAGGLSSPGLEPPPSYLLASAVGSNNPSGLTHLHRPTSSSSNNASHG